MTASAYESCSCFECSGSRSMRCEADFVSVALGLMRFICFTGRRSVVLKGGGVVLAVDVALLW